MKSRQPVTMGPVSRANIGTDPNFLAAQRLQQQGTDLQATDIPSGLNKALSQILGAYQEKKIKDDYATRDQAYGDDISHALGAAMGSPKETNSGITWNEQKPNMALAAKLLMNNPDTADIGMKLGLSDIEQQAANQDSERKFEQDLALRKASHPGEYMQGPQANQLDDASINAALNNMQSQMPAPGAASLKPPALPMQNGVVNLPPQDDANDFAQNPNAALNGSNGAAPAPTPIGDDYLKTLDPQMAAVVKLIGDGREKSSTILSRMKPEQKSQIMSAVAQYNPDYSANNFSGIGKFTYGATGDKVRSLNVSISHLNDTLAPAIDALGNGDIQMFNRLSNAYAEQTGSTAPTNFNSAKQIIAGEIVKAVVNSGGGVSDRDEAEKAINSANSPQQLKGVIDQYTSLLGGQLKGFQQQYTASTGKKDFDEKFLTPETKKSLEGVNNKSSSVKFLGFE